MDIFAGFVDNPKLYLTAMRLTFVYSTPLFILAVYIIITASHPTSSSLFRWFPMYQVCLYYTTDMFVGPGVTPIIYLPLLAGYPAGFARTVGIPTPVLVGLTYSSCWYKALSIAILFYIRYDAILPNDYPFKPKRSWAFTVFALYHLIFLVLTPFVMHSIVPDQTFAKKKLLEEYPTAPSSLNQPETIVIEVPYGAKTMFIIVVFFMPSVFIITTSTYTVSYCLYYLHQQKYSLSVKTLAIQRAILFSTIAEVCCSLILMVIPATAFFSCFLASYCYQGEFVHTKVLSKAMLSSTAKKTYQNLVNTSMYVLSMHGSWGTITILFAYKKYRQRIFSMLSNMTGRTTCRGNEANSRLSSKVGWAETN